MSYVSTGHLVLHFLVFNLVIVAQWKCSESIFCRVNSLTAVYCKTKEDFSYCTDLQQYN